MRKLNANRRGPARGQATSLVIFVHGYGANGDDLLGLADPLGEHLPKTGFVAPDAPNRCSGNPLGYEWFPIPWLDGSSQEAAEEGMAASVADLNGFIDATLAIEGVPAARTFLVGFSQGTMMSLYIAPRRRAQLAGVVGFSGKLLKAENLGADTITRPPFLLVHGNQDDMVPPASLPEAANALTAEGFEVFTHVSKGMGHGIAPDGLGVALEFIEQNLAGTP